MDTSHYYLPDLITPYWLYHLHHEAAILFEQATLQQVDKPEIKERGGVPLRKYYSVGGGGIQRTFYGCKSLSLYLSSITGSQIVPTGKYGIYSYYLNEHDFLDLHRDVYDCDLTLITCLYSNIPFNSPYGQLVLYSDRKNDSIKSIYHNREYGYLSYQLTTGESILIRGGIIPHAINPLSRNHKRVISALCFRDLDVH